MSDGTRPAPYPADTLARGWRFEVDMEKVKRSETWLRAKTGEVRGALLLLWGESWQQTPCGTLPADDDLVALIIDMPRAKFAKYREVLMRGWWLASDGRLYHETVTERVLAMLEKRAKDAERSANRRARQSAAAGDPASITGASRVTHAGDNREFDTKHLAQETKHQEEKHPPKPPRKRRGSGADAPTVTVELLVVDGLTPQHAAEWLAIRKNKRLTLTQTAWDEVKAEAVKAGLPIDEAIKVAIVNSWGGFKAKWLNAPDTLRPGATPDHRGWWETRQGIFDKGVELGIPGPVDDHPTTFIRFKASVWVAAGHEGPWWDKTDTAYDYAVKLRDGGNAVAAQVMAGLRQGAPHAA
jgi:uncharacterized protein YdaU (DUF1376 family)